MRAEERNKIPGLEDMTLKDKCYNFCTISSEDGRKIGSTRNNNDIAQNVFKPMVKMLPPVQKGLDGMMGLMKLGWPLFLEHIIQYVEQHRREIKEAEEQNKQT